MNRESVASNAHPARADTVAVRTVERVPRRGLGRRAMIAVAGLVALLGGAELYRRRSSAGQSVAGVSVHALPVELPDLRFTDENGASTGLASFRGRVVLLNVWATWCPPCREEMPTLDRLQQQLGGPSFEVVTLSIDSGGLPVVQAFFSQIGIRHLRPYMDSSHAGAALVGAGIPLTLLIDRDGREVARKLGPATWDDPQFVGLIRRFLPAPPAGPDEPVSERRSPAASAPALRTAGLQKARP